MHPRPIGDSVCSLTSVRRGGVGGPDNGHVVSNAGETTFLFDVYRVRGRIVLSSMSRPERHTIFASFARTRATMLQTHATARDRPADVRRLCLGTRFVSSLCSPFPLKLICVNLQTPMSTHTGLQSALSIEGCAEQLLISERVAASSDRETLEALARNIARELRRTTCLDSVWKQRCDATRNLPSDLYLSGRRATTTSR